jgi:hypothetical protein
MTSSRETESSVSQSRETRTTKNERRTWRQEQMSVHRGGDAVAVVLDVVVFCDAPDDAFARRASVSVDPLISVLARQSDPGVIFFQIKGGRPDSAELRRAALGRAQELSYPSECPGSNASQGPGRMMVRQLASSKDGSGHVLRLRRRPAAEVFRKALHLAREQFPQFPFWAGFLSPPVL